ncbi:MAG: hypothetical protein HFJ12_03020 [Bacilli bacterium]|nr:hypothetical protein [Bacilli bacterium]
MKQVVLTKSLNFITKYKDYSKEDIEKLKYGLEGIYLTITKLVIITLLSIIFGIFKEVIILLLLFNIIRYFGFGVHARKSGECLIFSILCFIGMPIIFLNIKINNNFILITGIICTVLLLRYAPADTEKRPLINQKKRLIRKIITILIGVIYTYIALNIHNYTYSILFILSIIIETVIVNPITYKILRQSYNNCTHVD